MLEKRSDILLNRLEKECGAVYKVIEIDEIISWLPKKQTVDVLGLKHILTYLDKGGYITIKYSDSEVYCLMLTPFGRQYIETETNEKQRNRFYKNFAVKFLIVIFLMTFCASFLGTMMFVLIYG